MQEMQIIFARLDYSIEELSRDATDKRYHLHCIIDLKKLSCSMLTIVSIFAVRNQLHSSSIIPATYGRTIHLEMVSVELP